MKIFDYILKTKVKFLESFSLASDSIESTRRIYLLIFISFIGIINLIPLGILAKLQKNNTLFFADLIVATILILNILNVRRKKKFQINLYIGILVTAILYIFLFLTGGIGKSAFVWYFTFPLIATYLLGSKPGGIAGILLLIPVFISTLVSLPEPAFVNYTVNFVIRFVLSYIVVLLFSYLFEHSREKTRDELSKVQNNLEDRVIQRTKELSEINLKLKNEAKERKRIETALRASEKNYRLITESTSDLIAITSFSLSPIYKYISPSHIQLGYKPEDMLGKSGLDLIYPPDKKKLFPILKNYTSLKIKNLLSNSENDLGITIEYRVYDKKGKLHHIQSTVNIIEKELLFVSKDVTDQKKAEMEKKNLQERLIHSEKMETLGQLAGGVAHDLNNVLGGIVGYPDLVLNKLDKGSDLRRYVEAIKRSGEKAAAMIEDLLGIVQKRVIDKTKIDLNEIVKEYFKSPEFDKLSSYHPDIKFEIENDLQLSRINGSQIHLIKILMNLVSNACEAMPKGGLVKVSVFNKDLITKIKGYLKDINIGKYVVLNVTDGGIGIQPKLMKRIFEPFYTKKNLLRSGTGLGMSVVLGIVIDHNGDIVIRSSKKKGTSFDIYFPASKRNIAKPIKMIRSDSFTGKGEWILVVDDIAEQRELLKNFLTSLSYKVDLVSSGEDAIKYIKKKTPDLVILDMIMNPGIDGLETYLKIRKSVPGIKVILASGYSDKNRIKKAFLNGVTKFIQKPFTIEEIGIAVRNELDADKTNHD